MASNDDKWAVRVIEQNALGQPEVSFIDAATGSIINNLSDYQVIDQSNIPAYDSASNPFSSMFDQTPTTSSSKNASGAKNTNGFVKNPLLHESENQGGTKDYFNPANEPSASNNFRYVDKPTAVLGLASRMPGLVGMGAKAVGAMMGVQNTHATGKAREFLGLEPNYLSGGLKNVFGDPQGYVADVKIGDEVYSVGLEAADAKGRTTLTPNEARQRALTQGVTLKEATKEEKKASIDAAKAAGVKPDKSFLGSLADNVFGSVRDRTMSAKDKAISTSTKTQTDRAVNNAPVSNPSYDLARGMGMGDLPARQMAGISYDLAGKGRSEKPSSGVEHKVADVVTDVLGSGYTVNVTSGMEPEGRSPVGSAHRHPSGVAADLDIKDPNGRSLNTANPADKQAIQDVAQGFAARYGGNFGMGPEYMGGKTMHMDTLDLSQHPGLGAQWGSLGKELAGTLDYSREYGLMPSSYYDQVADKAPTPTSRPELTDAIAQTTEPSLGTGLGLMNNMTTANPVGIDRFADITPEDRSLMAATLAGEIDTSKTDLSTEDGRKEAMGILSTIENRVGKYGSITDAINAPNQYSTWSNMAAANTANKNYGLNKGLYDGLVDSFVTDPTQNLGFTSYHANTVNPGWSASMADRTQIGAHTFGSLPEYQSKATTQSIGQGALDMVQAQTAFNTDATSAPSANSGLMDSMNTMESAQSSTQQSNQKDTTSQNDTSSTSNSSNSSGSGSDSGGHESGNNQSGSNSGGKAANSSGSPDDRDER